MNTSTQDWLATLLAEEAVKVRKLEIIFGPWWRHYAVPYEFPATLYTERSRCPYCRRPLGVPGALAAVPIDQAEPAHLDHMDPLSRGGEESVRNAVYCCGACNLAKGRRLFADWLTRLDTTGQVLAREIYQSKHGHSPEMFQIGKKQPRLTLPRHELMLGENVLRRLFPKPIVSGPPVRM